MIVSVTPRKNQIKVQEDSVALEGERNFRLSDSPLRPFLRKDRGVYRAIAGKTNAGYER